jgi:hypothetical protein
LRKFFKNPGEKEKEKKLENAKKKYTELNPGIGC